MLKFDYDPKDFSVNYGDGCEMECALAFLIEEAADRAQPAGAEVSYVQMIQTHKLRKKIVLEIHSGAITNADGSRLRKEDATKVLFSILAVHNIPVGWKFFQLRYVRPGHPDEVIEGEDFELFLERCMTTSVH